MRRDILFYVGFIIACTGFLMNPSNMPMMFIGSCIMIISNTK